MSLKVQSALTLLLLALAVSSTRFGFASGFTTSGTTSRPIKAVCHFLQAQASTEESEESKTSIAQRAVTEQDEKDEVDADAEAEAEADITCCKEPIDVSIPYDAPAKLAYEASDQSMEYGAFKTKFEADAVTDIISKQLIGKRGEKDENYDFDTILRTRRTINNFAAVLPAHWEETLENAIESAIHAPNHKRTEPWGFHLLGPKAIRKVCELNASLVTEKKGVKAGQAKLERWLEMPGWLVVTCHTEAGVGDMGDPSGTDREDYAAVCCAVQNLCLSLHNAGMGTKWTTGPVNYDSKFSEIVGLEKEEYVVGTIWFGTVEAKPIAPLKKKKVTDVLRKTK